MAGVGGDKVLGHTIGEGRRDEGVPGPGRLVHQRGDADGEPLATVAEMGPGLRLLLRLGRGGNQLVRQLPHAI
jgi:hypothetical protein